MSRDPELGRPERQANARLIALAPRMAEALMKVANTDKLIANDMDGARALTEVTAIVAELEKI